MKSLAFVLCLIFAAPSIAAEHLCAKPGEVTAAVKKAQPGDVIILADGTYHSADLVLDGTGTADRPIVVRAATPGKVVLMGSSRLRIGGSYLVVEGFYFWQVFQPEGLIVFRSGVTHEAQHCRVTQCAVIDCNPKAEDPPGPWISMMGSHNRVDHCLLKDKTYAGSVLDVWIVGNTTEPVSHQIDHNYFGLRSKLITHRDGDILYVGRGAVPSTASRIVVEANLFDQCDGGIDIITNCASETTYRQNTFLNSNGSLTLRMCNRCQVMNNYFIGGSVVSSGGVRVSGEEHTVASNYFVNLTGTDDMAALAIMDGYTRPKSTGYSETKRCVIAENVVVRCESPIAIGAADRHASRGSGDRLAPRETTLQSNIIVGSGKIVELKSASADLAWRGNFYDTGELGVRRPTDPPTTPDAWRQVPIGIGQRFGLACPMPPPAFGPQIPPLRHADVGPTWFSLVP
jgi:poly(beta-D-mannuronate) lyase